MAKWEKIKRGEKVVVTMLGEDLQDRWDSILKVREELKEKMGSVKAYAKAFDDVNDSDAEAICVLNCKHISMSQDFWMDVNRRYGLWKIPHLGIRDGYCIVQMPSTKDKVKGFLQKVEEAGKEVFGEEFPSAPDLDMGFLEDLE